MLHLSEYIAGHALELPVPVDSVIIDSLHDAPYWYLTFKTPANKLVAYQVNTLQQNYVELKGMPCLQ